MHTVLHGRYASGFQANILKFELHFIQPNNTDRISDLKQDLDF